MKRAWRPAAAQVVSFTRRSDGPANSQQLDSFLDGLASENGAVTYAHPRFALNKGNDKVCSYEVKPGAVISWWSKDFGLLIQRWPQHETVLSKYKHHFSFAINGPERSLLEPGLESTLCERVEVQLRWLVDKCRAYGQDPNSSILVKLDPITVYTAGATRRDNTGHFRYLCEFLHSYGLTRVHMSFTQFDIGVGLKGRLRAISREIVLHDITDDEKRAILSDKIVPFAKAYGFNACQHTTEDSYVPTAWSIPLLKAVNFGGGNVSGDLAVGGALSVAGPLATLNQHVVTKEFITTYVADQILKTTSAPTFAQVNTVRWLLL